MGRNEKKKGKTERCSIPKVSNQYLNRELSWVAFNERVFAEAANPDVPLLERVKFFCITHSNLDEFFEVRVGGLKQEIESEVVTRSPDGMTASETLRAVELRVRALVDRAYATWRNELVPDLARHGIHFLDPTAIAESDRAWVESYYRTQVHPVVTPMAVDPSHPFPELANKTLNLVARLKHLEDSDDAPPRLAVIQVPRVLPRLVRLPRDDQRQDYVFLADVIAQHLGELFPETSLIGCWPIRLTRNSELYIDEEETSNLLNAVENELHNRRRGQAVRLEVSPSCPQDLRDFLLAQHELTLSDLYLIDGPINPTRLLAVCEGDHSPELRDTPFVGAEQSGLGDGSELFAAIRESDRLLHHPYESFETVVRFLQTAAADPDVLAIKQTLYRTGGDARIVGALMDAAGRGKSVTAIVELKARFDEANNIQWARKLVDAGVHVVWGMVGLKVHAKISLIVRREGDGLQRYVHFGTGNYNAATARLYTDISLFTAKPDFGEDATRLFNQLTGSCKPGSMRRLIVAPHELQPALIAAIDREAEHARRGLPSRIIAKMNALVDESLIQALYRASEAGVEIDLIVRGICCLRPGIPGWSGNIRVRSIVDRFLEHSRIYYFENARQPKVWIASADWMPRNLYRRVEIAVPVEDGNLRDRLVEEILRIQLADTSKARCLDGFGNYSIPKVRSTDPIRRSQVEFMQRSRNSEAPVSEPDSADYDKPVREARKRSTKRLP